MQPIPVAVLSVAPGLMDALREHGGCEDRAAWVSLCDGLDQAPGVTVAIVSARSEANAAIAAGAHDALVWPDEGERLGGVLVSAARAAEAMLSLLRYKTAFRESYVWQELATEDITLVDVSAGFESSTGYSRDESVGRTPKQLFRGGTHGRAFYDALTRDVLEKGVWRGDMLGWRKDGSLGVSTRRSAW